MPIEEKIQSNINLARFSTFNIGGNAKYYVEVKDKISLNEAYAWAKEKNEKVYVLGGGSNVLINSRGVFGLVIRIVNDEIKVQGDRLVCDAGATLARLITISKANNLSGLEWAAGIPRATVGGSIRGNAGSPTESMASIVETVEAFDSVKNKFELLSNRDCLFNYRSSLFKDRPELIVWRATLIFQKASVGDIQSKIDKYLNFRSESHPKLPSAGSIFKNVPIKKIDENNIGLANFVKKSFANEDTLQVAAGFIIDKVLGLKGATSGGAKISLEHANFIVNTGRADSEDVIELINRIKADAKALAKINLEEEIVYFGF